MHEGACVEAPMGHSGEGGGSDSRRILRGSRSLLKGCNIATKKPPTTPIPHTSPSRGRAGKTAVWSPYGTRPEYGTRGVSHPRNGQVPAGAPQQYDPLLAVRADGGVV